MSVSVITVGSNSVNLVSMPSSPGLRSVQFNFEDTIAIVRYPFTGQTQTQAWPGADMWSGTMELPPLQQSDLNAWKAFLMECRGMQNGFQLGDPLKTTPAGSVNFTGSSPIVTGSNAAASQTVTTDGWEPTQNGLLLPGDYIQIGYRLHVVLDEVNSDSGGNATLSIWPSLRESPPAGEAIIVNSPVGLFRRASNKQGWSIDQSRHTALSFQVMEYR